MKESTFGKREAPKKKVFESVGVQPSCASSCRSESSSEVSESTTSSSKSKPQKNRYRVSFIREEEIVADSYDVYTYHGRTTLKLIFKSDGKTSCIREGVSKIEKL